MRRDIAAVAVVALGLVASCDALWGIDRLDFAKADAPRAADAHPHTGPYLHFTMDTIEAGDTTRDSVAGVKANCEPDCPIVVSGHLAGALELNSVQTDQRLEVASSAPVYDVREFSVTGWFRLSTFATEVCLWSKPYSTGAADTWQVCIGSAGAISFFTYGPGGETAISTDNGWVALDNIFHHVAIVDDGVTKYLYWDGEVAVSGPAQPMLLVDDDPILIGNDDNNGAYDAPLTGAIDDVQFFSYALDRTEIAVMAAQ